MSHQEKLFLKDEDIKLLRTRAITKLIRNIKDKAQDPIEKSCLLLEKIQKGQFVALHGPKASRKSMRVLQLQEQLNKKGINSLSFEQISMKSINKFWQTLDIYLNISVPKQFEFDNINSASDFDIAFKKNRWKNLVVLLINEFDMLYSATDDICLSCLSTLHSIKATKDCYASSLSLSLDLS
ncbi:24994_t:CDS:2, partial [Cetraspora pellucida]